MYAKITEGEVAKYPYMLSDLKKDYPNVAFPKNISDEQLEQFGMYRVVLAQAPDCDFKTQKQVESQVPELIDGQWTITFSIVDLTPQEIQTEKNTLAQHVRDKRNHILSLTDWTQAEDAPVDKAVWASYRQELRNIPSQEGFPWDVQWPNRPDRVIQPE